MDPSEKLSGSNSQPERSHPAQPRRAGKRPEAGRRAEKKQQARQDILSAAQGLMDDRGYADAGMRAIAQAAGQSYQTLYNYFPTKAAIAAELLNQQIGAFDGRYQAVADAYQGDLTDALDAFLAITFELLEGPQRSLWRDAALDLVSNQQAQGRLTSAAAQLSVQQLLREAQTGGELSNPQSAKSLEDVLLDLIDYRLLRFLLAPDPNPVDCRQRLGEAIGVVLTPYLTPHTQDLP